MLNTKSLLSVDFGAGSLKLAEFEINEAGALVLKQYAVRSLGLEGSQEAKREAVVLKALQEGWIGGAGLDVHEPTPPPADSPFRDLPNVIMTPHCAGRTREADIRRWRVVGENLRRWKQGRPPANVVMDLRPV